MTSDDVADEDRVAAVRQSFRDQTELFRGPDSVFAARASQGPEWVGPLTGDELALDVACGAAHVPEELAPHVRTVVGVDLTPELLAIGAARLRDAGIDNVLLQEGDAEGLPFVDDSFDVVNCRSSLHHFAHPDRAMAEMRRVARPGGRIVITDLVVPAGVDRDRYDGVHRLLDPSHLRALTDDELLALCRAAGRPDDAAGASTRSNFAGRLPLDLILTPVSDEAGVRAALRDEIDGGLATGFSPEAEGDNLTVVFATRTIHTIVDRPA
jgi:SAM-dependent methyltransferase